MPEMRTGSLVRRAASRGNAVRNMPSPVQDDHTEKMSNRKSRPSERLLLNLSAYLTDKSFICSLSSMTFPDRATQKFLLIAVISSLVLLSCGGGGSQVDQSGDGGKIASSSGNIAEGSLCDTLDAVGQTAENTELTCQLMGDGKLAWRPSGGGDSGGGAGDSSAGEGMTVAQAVGRGDCDKSSTVSKYSASIGDVSKMSHVYPLGGMLTSHITPIDHIYVYYPESAEDHSVAAGSYLVTSPADGIVTRIEDFQKTNNYPYPDHRVVIEHSCNLYSVFIHIGVLSSGLDVGSKVEAGDTIADDSYSPGYDFSTFDGTVNLQFINPSSYSQAESWKKYTANTFDYFPADIKSQWEAKSLRASAPFDGKIDWDMEGTAQGNWFVQDTNGYRGKGDQTASFDNHGKIAHGYWDTHLAIAPDAVDDKSFIYSIGDWEGCPCQFMTPDNVDPKTITSSDTAPRVLQMVEFENVNPDGSQWNPMKPTKGYTLKPGKSVVGLLVVQVMADGSMKVEKMPGVTKTAGVVFTDKAVIYVR